MKAWWCFLALAAIAGVSACVGPQAVAPVEKRLPSRPAAGTEVSRTLHAAPKPSRRTGDDRPAFYTVQRGDTLFAIALDFGFDYRDLAAWNEIADPALIRVGRQLRLTAPLREAVPETRALRPADAVTAEALGGPGPNRSSAPSGGPGEVAKAPAPAVSASAGVSPAAAPILTEPQARTLRYSDQALAQLGGRLRPGTAAMAPAPSAAATPPARPEPKVEPAAPIPPKPQAPGPVATPDSPRDADDRVDWIWPARGELLYRFGETGKLKGIGVAGKAGQPIVAAAVGKVVYAGAGLRGYGKLVIVKHNETYLSVYAHNSTLLVKEGDSVRRGQKIAEMGDTDAARVGLHFEIRRFGKPLDPLVQLPHGADAPG